MYPYFLIGQNNGFKSNIFKKQSSFKRNVVREILQIQSGKVTVGSDGKEKIPKKSKKIHKNNVLWNEWRQYQVSVNICEIVLSLVNKMFHLLGSL